MQSPNVQSPNVQSPNVQSPNVQRPNVQSNDTLVPDPRWYAAPNERRPQFFLIYSKVSVALQLALRELAPAELFTDLTRYEDLRLGYAMLVYAASRPFRPKTRTEFTYDVLNPSVMTTFFRLSRPKLMAGLAAAQAKLHAAGLDEIARHYDPREVKYIVRAARKQKRFR